MSIWFKPYTVEEFRGLYPDTMMAQIGIEITEVGDDFLRGTMPVDRRTHQPFGMLHGGASVTLAETLGSIATLMTLDQSKFSCVGQEINANHIRGVRDGIVTGTARPFHIGTSSQVWSIEILDPRGKLVCISRITMAVRPRTEQK